MSMSRDANQIMSIKVEDVSDTEKEENHMQLRFSGIKAEHEVSCMSVSLLGRFPRSRKSKLRSEGLVALTT
jgi:hypothetical protein